MTTIRSKIISMQSVFTATENEIAQYVLNHAEDVISSTITNTAKKTNTSEASINRFCKKLGLKGFNNFKVALAQETVYNSMQEQEAADDNNGLISSVSHDYRKLLTSTSANLDEEAVMQAAHSISDANKVLVFSHSTTASVATDLEFKLSTIGLNAKAVLDIGSICMYAGNVQECDVVIIISPSVIYRDIFQAITVCKDRGAQVLIITSYEAPKLNDLVDFKFIACDKFAAHNSISLSNSFIFLFITDIIFSAILKENKLFRQKRLGIDALFGNQSMIDEYYFNY